MKMHTNNLMTKSLVLVAFPLICQVIFVCLLLGAVFKVQNLLDKKADAVTSMVQLNKIGLDSIQILMINAKTSGRRDEILNALRNTPAKIDKLAPRLPVDPVLQAQLAALKQSLGRSKELLIQTNQKLQDGSEWLQLKPGYQAEIAGEIAAISQSVFIATERLRKLSTSIDAETKIPLQLIVQIGIGVNVLVAIGLSLLYATQIRRPLIDLSETCQRFVERSPLLARKRMPDEIAAVDHIVRQLSKDLDETDQRHRDLVQNTMAAIVVLTLDGMVQEANISAVHMFLLEEEHLDNMSLYQHLTSAASAELAAKLEEARLKDAPVTFEMQMARSQSSSLTLAWTCVFDRQQESFFCCIRDISHERNSEKLFDEFLTAMRLSLDLPLQTIANKLMSVEESCAPPKLDEDFVRCRVNVAKLRDSLDDFLYLQSIEEGQIRLSLSRVSLSALVSECLSLLNPLLKAKQLTLQVDLQPFEIICDRRLTFRLLMNLIGNAIRYTQRNGFIHIAVSVAGSDASVAVTDSGPGVPPDLMKVIFEHFRQGTQVGEEGSGLELALCRTIAEAHGGVVTLESPSSLLKQLHDTTDPGSTFTFSMPVSS